MSETCTCSDLLFSSTFLKPLPASDDINVCTALDSFSLEAWRPVLKRFKSTTISAQAQRGWQVSLKSKQRVVYPLSRSKVTSSVPGYVKWYGFLVAVSADETAAGNVSVLRSQAMGDRAAFILRGPQVLVFQALCAGKSCCVVFLEMHFHTTELFSG